MSATRYARLTDGREIAYRTFSESTGPTIVLLPAGTMPVEVLDEDPQFALFLRTLGRYGSLHAIDRPGIGASDALDPDTDYSEQVVDACLAVFDDVGATTAWLVAAGGGPMALAKANNRCPERSAGGVLVNPVREAIDDGRLEQVLGRDDQTFDDVMRNLAPSRWDDPAYRAWYERAGRLGASATAARAFYGALRASGAAFRAAPDPIRETRPVLVLHRRGSRRTSFEDATWWAERFPGGTARSIEGDDTPIEAPDSGLIADTIGAFITGARIDPIDHRPLAAVLFLDLVSSTEQAASAGDSTWRGVLDRFEAAVASVVAHHGGALVKHTGDGALATFSTGSRSLAAAAALRRRAHELDLECRIGVHVGEIELRGDDVGGLAVHIAARVMDRAEPGRIVVSSTVVETTFGAPWVMRPRGTTELRGVDRPWDLYELADPDDRYG